jgi:adenylosuccinate synthase
MKRGTVVIGANYGDEGTGLVTDAYAAAAGPDALVVRFNGGAQAGHTVVAPDGRRHVFSHVGGGTLAGAASFLSRFFVANPILFNRERAALAGLGVVPRVAIDRRAPVTTPWDMLINQAVETARGTARHGSCGIGFGETIERNQDARVSVTIADLDDVDRLAATLDAIRRDYVPARLARLGLADRWSGLRDLVMSAEVLENYRRDVAAFLSGVTVGDDAAIGAVRHVIFEGAQGLLLDQDRGAFPHVTRSNTGLRNALVLAAEAGIEALDVTYVTRAYVTRHGAGPLAHELGAAPFTAARDSTNVPNAWQGSLRYAWLDLDILRRAIADDLSDAPASMPVSRRLAVTCLDQVGGRIRYVEGGRERSASTGALVAAAAGALGVRQVWTSVGPGRADVARVDVGARAAA